MEENQTPQNEYQESMPEKKKSITFWQILLIVLLVLLLEFGTIFAVANWAIKKVMSFSQMDKIEKMINKDMRDMDKVFNQKAKFVYPSSKVINLKENENEYKIYIDLRAFDNNPDNIKVEVFDNTLKINATSIKETKNNREVSELHQTYMFGDEVNLEDMTEETIDNDYIITLPMSEARD